MNRNTSSTGWDEEVFMLVEMGFSAPQAHDALEVCGGNMDDAYDFLCSNAGAVSTSQLETQTAAQSFSLDALVGMGFDSTKARQALDATDGRLDDAVAYLLSGKGKPGQCAPPKKKLATDRSAAKPGATYYHGNKYDDWSGRKKSFGRAEHYDDDGSRAPPQPSRRDPMSGMSKKPKHDEMDHTGNDEATGRSNVRIRIPPPPQSNTQPGAFRVGGDSVANTVSGAGTVVVGDTHQDERTIQSRSIAPVEAEIVEDDLQERRELEAQLRRVLEERENAVVARIIDQNPAGTEQEHTAHEDGSSFTPWWTKRRKRLVIFGTMFLVVFAVAIGIVIVFSGAGGTPTAQPIDDPSTAPALPPSPSPDGGLSTTTQPPTTQPPTLRPPTVTSISTSILPDPLPKWTATFRPMLDNTGLVCAPDDSAVYATSSDGAVALFSPDDGTVLGEFQPSGDGTVPFSCNGEVDFNSAGDTVIYAVTEGDSCKVYALGHGSLDVKWESPELAGVCEGTPRYADEDAYVFVTHNAADGSAGRFSVLDTAAGATVIYTTEVTEGPFGPFGFYPSPFPGGNYGAGAGNTNDLAVWGLKPSPSATGGENGGVWAFQMPPTTAISGPIVTKIVETTSWRHTSPPRIANMGQWAYWLVSRSAIRAWYSSPWTVGADGEYWFDSGVPSFKAAPYTPAINGDVPTILCGGPADESFACMDATNIVPSEGGGAPLWSMSTTGTGVYGDPVMSPDYSRVYWTDNAGLVSSADPSTGMDGWTAPTGVSLEANPTLCLSGSHLFFADVSGNIVCWQVAE